MRIPRSIRRLRLLATLALCAWVGLAAIGCGSDDVSNTASMDTTAAGNCGTATQPEVPAKQDLASVPLQGKIEADLPQLDAEVSVAAHSVAYMQSIGAGESRLTIRPAQFAIVQLRFTNRGERSIVPAEVFLDRLVMQDASGTTWGTPTNCSGLLSAVVNMMHLEAPNEKVAPGDVSRTFWVFGVPQKQSFDLVVRYTGKYVALRPG